MKNLGKKLTLNKTTIDILDDSALLNIKGGKNSSGAGTSCGTSDHCLTCITNGSSKN